MNIHDSRHRAAAIAIVSIASLLPGFRSLAAAEPTTPDRPIVLFDGTSLTGWAPFAGNAVPPASETWMVSDKVLRCSGKPNGYLRTANRYQNYRLTVEWRWVPVPSPTDNQGRPRNRNSGVLLHMQGDDAIWPKSLEAQLMENNAGDFFVIGGVETSELATARDQAVAAAGSDEEAVKKAKNNRRVPKRSASSEKPIGEWNTYDIVCRGDAVTVSVNGVAQNHTTGTSVREGHICLQSEGAPIEFRNIRLEPLP